MQTPNLEVVKAAVPEEIDLVEVMATDDPVAALIGDATLVASDLEVVFGGSQSGAPELHYQGLDGFIQGWADWLEPWDTYRIRLDELIEARDSVVTFVTVHARTSRHGVEIEHQPAAVWTVRDGKLRAVHFFLERKDALEFAGLSSP
jgi:ketosteroid isomerase-like protein